MSNRISRAGILSPILLLLACLPAGAAENDFELWTEAGVRYRISRQFRLKFDQHYRHYQDGSELMPELAVSYRPFRFLRLEGGYRFIAEFIENADDRIWHRLFADVRLRLRLRSVTLRHRLRFQEVISGEGLGSKQAIRNKLGAEVRLGAGFVPFVSTELFNRLDDSRRAWFKWRLTTGLDYILGSHQFTLFYRLEIYLFNDNQGAVTCSRGDMNHVFALGYHFRF